MSYDIDVRDRAGHINLERNYTVNIYPMLRAVWGDGLGFLDGMTTESAAGWIQLALRRFDAERPKFEAMNPCNQWGDLDGLIVMLKDVLRSCFVNRGGSVKVYQ